MIPLHKLEQLNPRFLNLFMVFDAALGPLSWQDVVANKIRKAPIITAIDQTKRVVVSPS